MRPTPIPDDEVWDGATRIVVGPPGNDLDSDVAAVEVLRDIVATDTTGTVAAVRTSVRCTLEDDDLDHLAAGGTVWLSFYGLHILPFAVTVQPPQRPRPHVRLEVDFTGAGAPGFRAFMGGVPDGMGAADFADGCAEALRTMAAEWRAEQAARRG